MNINDNITRVLDYWFADTGSSFDVKRQNKLWFIGGAAVDREISTLFEENVERALTGGLDHWAATPQGMLALIILLDQFTRNIYRGDARAFAGDERVLAVVDRGLQKEFDQQLGYIQRIFFYMPLMHAENLIDQQRGIDCFQRLLEDIPEVGKAIIQSNIDFAIKHCQIIEEFGRFPYRNAVLGRKSTKEELEYLNGGGARFGQ